jgi:hypothetical protein
VTPPKAPSGLVVFNPTIDSLTLSWDLNTELDVVGYFIYRSLSMSGQFKKINPNPINDYEYIDYDLIENTIYYYKITAIDDVNLESKFSGISYGKTAYIPREPEINNTIADFEIEEDSYDDKSINLFYWFKDENNDELTFRVVGDEYIAVTIHQTNGTVILEPDKDWNGYEELTFYASDGKFEIYDEVTITVTSVNDPPNKPIINKPIDGKKIKKGDYLNFDGYCIDPDLIYGDELFYIWSSDISGKIGEGSFLNNIELKEGKHTITLTVSDKEGLSSHSTILVTVQTELDIDKDNDNIPDIWEDENGLNPYDKNDAMEDFDGDGLNNLLEYMKGTNPGDKDTDDDGLTDGDEVNLYYTNATNSDTDYDGHGDGEDQYPNDPDKWEKESSKKQDKDADLTWLGIVIIIIIIVIIMILFLVIKRKKKPVIEQEPQPAAETEKQIQQQIPPQPQQAQKQPPTQPQQQQVQQTVPPQQPQNLYPPQYQPPSPPVG